MAANFFTDFTNFTNSTVGPWVETFTSLEPEVQYNTIGTLLSIGSLIILPCKGKQSPPFLKIVTTMLPSLVFAVASLAQKLEPTTGLPPVTLNSTVAAVSFYFLLSFNLFNILDPTNANSPLNFALGALLPASLFAAIHVLGDVNHLILATLPGSRLLVSHQQLHLYAILAKYAAVLGYVWLIYTFSRDSQGKRNYFSPSFLLAVLVLPGLANVLHLYYLKQPNELAGKMESFLVPAHGFFVAMLTAFNVGSFFVGSDEEPADEEQGEESEDVVEEEAEIESASKEEKRDRAVKSKKVNGASEEIQENKHEPLHAIKDYLKTQITTEKGFSHKEETKYEEIRMSRGKGSLEKKIEDEVETLKQKVTSIAEDLKSKGVTDIGIIIGIDCTASNVYTGNVSFGGKNLHHISEDKLNLYEQVISAFGAAVEQFQSSKKIPVYLFGDSETKDQSVRRLAADNYTGILKEYRQQIPRVNLSGPTSFTPLIKEASKIAKDSRKYHILVIIGDGAVASHEETVKAIEEASQSPLSILAIGVGDGDKKDKEDFPDDPWQGMKKLNSENFEFIQLERYQRVEDLAKKAFSKIPAAYKHCQEKIF